MKRGKTPPQELVLKKDMGLLDIDLVPYVADLRLRVPSLRYVSCGRCKVVDACPLYDPMNPKQKCRIPREREGLLKVLNDPDKLRSQTLRLLTAMDMNVMKRFEGKHKLLPFKEAREVFKSMIEFKNAFYPETKELNINLRGRKEIFASRIKHVMDKIVDADFEEVNESEIDDYDKLHGLEEDMNDRTNRRHSKDETNKSEPSVDEQGQVPEESISED